MRVGERCALSLILSQSSAAHSLTFAYVDTALVEFLTRWIESQEVCAHAGEYFSLKMIKDDSAVVISHSLTSKGVSPQHKYCITSWKVLMCPFNHIILIFRIHKCHISK